jgi:putative membrane-bound dehydrogenase-like protein
MFRATLAVLAVLCLTGLSRAADVKPDTYLVGVAEVDITPKDPVRMNGFGSRRDEFTRVNHPIYARAISIRHSGDSEPLVLMTVEVLGITADHRADLVKRLKGKVSSERLAVTATHTHCGPMVSGANPTLFGVPIPDDHLKHIEAYTATYLDKLEQAAVEALKDPKPAHLYWGVGTVGFAKNRRPQPNGPTDHDLPVLVVKDAKTAAVKAVYTGYACHCTSLTHNSISGDWAGYAAAGIGKLFPGAVGLVSIGCGADQNPDAREPTDKDEAARVRGHMIADEVKRLAGGFLAPIQGKPVCTLKSISLPLADHPDRKGWEKLAEQKNAIGHHARVQLAKLDKGEKLMTSIDYPIQSWAFGESLAMVHLPGEVVVDYGIRLKAELDRSRVWITAYANNNPCYIPSERILKEGGYEGGGAMIYYDVPSTFKPGLEEPIVHEVKAQLPKFASPTDGKKLGGTQPLSPQQSLKATRVGTKLTVDLVAAEPLVSDPVAIAFGPDGKLWVTEMLDYPCGKTGQFEPGGRVRFLEDTNGNGTFDTATTFLDNLPFPTGALPWRKGVLVCAAPDILYAEDADGDGKADKVEKLFSGFGSENYQGRVNGLAYGLDGWVYGSCGLFGGTITSSKTGQKLGLGNRDFRIKPDTGEIEPAVGRTQQGRVRNDWGDWFGCDNSNLAWHYPLADHLVKRNPFVAPPNPTVNLAPDNKLFPARAPQLFNLSGVGGRATAACGIGVYRDTALGANFTGNLFTCEPVNLCVTRRVLKPNGSTFTAERADAEADKEFLAGTDPWFRPVMATTGPDGGLWVADMYRFVIEHPRWIPPGELAKVDPRAGAGLGRIYRVRAEGEAPKAWPRLDKMTTAELVAALDSPNGWQRDMATEMLVWKDDRASVPLLVKLLDAKRPETRLHALTVLGRFYEEIDGHITTALTDSHPGVRKNAVRIAEAWSHSSAKFCEKVMTLADDPDPQVRLQLAFTLAAVPHKEAGETLARMAVKDAKDPYITVALVSSLNPTTFPDFMRRPEVTQLTASPLLPKLITTAVGLGDDKALSVLLAKVTTVDGGRYAAWQFTAAESVLDAWQRAANGKGPPAEVVKMFISARTLATDATAAADLRAAAVRLLGREKAKLVDDIATLATLLGAKTPAPVQAAAVFSLARATDDKAAEALMKGWGGYTPAVQSQVMSALLGRPAWVPKVLESLAAGTLPPSAVSPGTRQALLASSDPEVKALAERAFAGVSNADRVKQIANYTGAMPKAGDVAKGKAVFAKTCAPCHKLDGVGHSVGPDLAALANKSPEYLLTEILDPNRNIDTRYLEYVVNTTDGRTLTGLLASETAAGVTLRQADGKEVTLLRADFDSFMTSGRSLMPDGLEKDVPATAMIDLLSYLTSSQMPPKKLQGNTPAVVKMAGERAVLPASAAEVRGTSLTFEPEFGNLGMWHGAKDQAAWRVVLPAAGEFDVYIDFACDDPSAGNPIALDGGEPTIRSKVIGTGGWANYRLMRLGTFKLPAGEVKLVVRPDSDALKGALIDLRTVLLVPKGQKPDTVEVKPKPTEPGSDKPADIARFLLDERTPAADRQAAVTKHLGKAAAILKEMAATLPPDKEGYTTSWMWRVAIASGKRNDADELRAILDVSLPKQGEKLRDWQAVVVGGGVVNGLSMEHGWPGPRVAELIGKDAGLKERWDAALDAAEKMADDTATRNAVRYDALRLIPLRGWGVSGQQLTKYLSKGTEAELQMGAVSGLVDVDAPEATAALVEALGHLTGMNRELALKGLLRTDDRANALLDAVEKGAVKKEALGDGTINALLASKSPKVKDRAEKVLR